MFIQYLINQSKKPSGIVGQVIAKIWTSYFKKLSLWTIKQTTIIDNSRVLEIGYGGGSTIKNLLALNKHLEIHGIDIYISIRRVGMLFIEAVFAILVQTTCQCEES